MWLQNHGACSKGKLHNYWDIPCQLTCFMTFFCRPSPILKKFVMFVGLDEKMSHTKFQISKSNSF